MIKRIIIDRFEDFGYNYVVFQADKETAIQLLQQEQEKITIKEDDTQNEIEIIPKAIKYNFEDCFLTIYF